MVAAQDVGFGCSCGQITGTLRGIDGWTGSLAVCHCPDCRAAEVYLHQPDPDPNGVRLYQTTPDRIQFITGQDKLAVLRLSDKGLMRWYAVCCGAPLFNTMPGPKFGFASLHVARVADPAPLGPVIGDVNGPGGNSGLARLVLGVLRRSTLARLSGRWKQTPFFDVGTGAPVVAPKVLTPKERSTITP
jgi:hypothetical protein